MRRFLFGFLFLASITSYAGTLDIYECTYEKDKGFEGQLVVSENNLKDSVNYKDKQMRLELFKNKLKLSIGNIVYGMYPDIDAIVNTVKVSISLASVEDTLLVELDDGVLLGCKKYSFTSSKF